VADQAAAEELRRDGIELPKESANAAKSQEAWCGTPPNGLLAGNQGTSRLKIP
jgi:hypothetical protein